jgi:tRNA threonylcarbamoyladenosine biosynthesis protein TsaE
MLNFSTNSPDETRTLARALGERLRPGDVLLLHGDLGAGKTTFTQGLAEGLGVPEPVTSPTFSLLHEFRGGRLPLFHFDPYRLGGAEEVAGIGFEEYLERGGVVVVEWAERLEWLTPTERLEVTLSGEDEARVITLEPRGARYVERVRGLEAKP